MKTWSMTQCIGNDPACPCQDGDACHYRNIPGSPGWPVKEEDTMTKPTASMVKFSDVLEIVSGVAPPDSYYYKGDTRGIQAWQSAIGRVQVELERYLSVQGETDDE